MEMELPSYVKTAIEYLNRNGYECYVVGGAVRSTLLHEEIHDYDLTTNALPEETEAVFRDFPVIRTGMKHGTLTVVIDGEMLEITTYRKDSGYKDHRHPDSVAFSSSLKEDCARRDFTINALCYHPEEGILDFFGGQEDIRKQIIRCIGDPEQRLNEDALRILRAVRFAARLGFTVDPLTKAALLKKKETLRYVSEERIRSETDRFLAGKGCPDLFTEYIDIFAVFLPELNSLSETEKEEIREAFRKAPDNSEIRLAVLFSSRVFPDAEEVMRRLTYPNHAIRRIKSLLSVKDMPFDTETDIRYIINRLIPEFDCYTDYMKAVRKDFPAERVREMHDAVIRNGDCCFLSDLAVNGKDMLALGLKGKEISDALQKSLSAVIEKRIPNNKEEIIAYLKKKCKSDAYTG